MKKDFLAEIVKKYCKKENIIKKGEKILLAVSGGPDSQALLHIFFSLSKELCIEIGVVHVEHGLRGLEAIQDQEFVKKSTGRLGIPFFTESINVKKLKSKKESIEEGARRLRYEVFLRVMKKQGYNKIATGHTRDDNVETIIYRLISGTGPSGFCGILPEEGKVIHPLLCISKKEIFSYLERNGLNYRIDPTNMDLSIMRNRIRYRVIPELQGVNPRFDEHILNLARIIKEENKLIEKKIEETIKSICIDSCEQKVTVDYERFKLLPVAIKRRVILKLVNRVIGVGNYAELKHSCDFNIGIKSDKDFFPYYSKACYLPFSVLEDIATSKYNGNKILYISKLITIQKQYNLLVINKRVVTPSNPEYLYFVKELEGSIELKEIGKMVTFRKVRNAGCYQRGKLYIDNAKLHLPLIIRNRRKGDRIVLTNLGTKKLKDMFIDDKVPPVLREKVPVLVSGGDIVGVFCSYYGKADRISDKYKVNPQTESIVVCELN